MLEYLLLGIALIIAGAVLIAAGTRKTNKTEVSANGGSVAVGGNNSGPIINTNINAPEKIQTSSGHQMLTVLGIGVEVIGIAVTIWHAIHLAAK